jgi:catechol 2,3-dioxygenase-like lactoylglutathione lyase family enzyme
MIGAVAHIGITVPDMDKAIAFYQEALGLTVISDYTMEGEEISDLVQVPDAKLRSVFLRNKDERRSTPVELLYFSEPATQSGQPYPGVTHNGITEIAFWVKDLDATCEALKEHGVEFYSRPHSLKLDDTGTLKVVYCKDPFGTTLELMEMVNEKPAAG